MSIELDPRDKKELEAHAEENGKTLRELLTEIVRKFLMGKNGVPGTTHIEEFDALLKEIDALPDEPDSNDGLSGSMDHNQIIYRKPNP